MSEWVSVDDRLPISEKEMDQDYLTVEVIVATNHFVSSCYFEAGNEHCFWGQFRDYGDAVTHWMALPEPPK